MSKYPQFQSALSLPLLLVALTSDNITCSQSLPLIRQLLHTPLSFPPRTILLTHNYIVVVGLTCSIQHPGTNLQPAPSSGLPAAARPSLPAPSHPTWRP